MKAALPLVGRLLGVAEKNPALLVVIASLSVPLGLIWAALSYVAAPLTNLIAFLVLGALALFYSAWIVLLAVRHWPTELRSRLVPKPE